METVQTAITFGIPVIFINIGEKNNDVYLIDPDNLNQTLDSVLAEPAQNDDEYKVQLITLVNQLIVGFDKPTDFINEHDADLLREYFDSEEKTNKWSKWSFRKECWKNFKSFFRPEPSPKPDSVYKPFNLDQVHKPFKLYRERARELNYHYSDLYRGAFLSNYIMAIMAVSLAAISLALLATSGNEPPLCSLFILGFLKLMIVIYILFNTEMANNENWNKKAIDFRYFLERLRSMYYLPLAGSYHPPEAVSFSSRKIQQSLIDWLFSSLVRSISPANLLGTTSGTILKSNGSDWITIKKLSTISAEKVVTEVHKCWINEQIEYHDGNTITMRNMNNFIEKSASILTRMVIVVVLFDLFLICGEYFHLFSIDWEDFAKAATPWLITVTVILPAVIAALSGIRSQAECQRLAERSEAMKTILKKHDGVLADQTLKRIQKTNLGSQALDSLYLTEHVATRFSQEVSEWTVLYEKEVNDPG